MRQTIGLRDLLEFEQRTQGEEQTREAERLVRAARENPPRDRRMRTDYTLPKVRLPFKWAGSWPEDGPEE
jgi:hypothetical protein